MNTEELRRKWREKKKRHYLKHTEKMREYRRNYHKKRSADEEYRKRCNERQLERSRSKGVRPWDQYVLECNKSSFRRKLIKLLKRRERKLMQRTPEERRKIETRKKAKRHKIRNDPKKNPCPINFINYRKLCLIANRRQAARRKKIEFTITRENIVWPEFCPVLGIKLDYHTRGKVLPNLPTIDRVDPRFGYTPENSRIISFRANTIKSFATLKELKLIVAYVERVKAEASDLKALDWTKPI